MLFRQSDLALDPIQEANAILNEAEYLAESESTTSAMAIPVVENARIGAYVVKFDDLSRLAEDHGMTFDEAMVTVAESNGVDVQHLAVAVRETSVMAHPGIVNELCNVVVTPLPETDTMYQFTEACVDAFVESGDTYYMDLLLNEADDKGPKPGEAGGAAKYANDGTGYKVDKDNKRTDYITAGGRVNLAHMNARRDRAIAKAEMQNASGVKKLLKAVKYYGWNTPKERILAAINALQKKYQEMIREIPEDEKQRSFWQSILKTVDKYISKLTHLFKKKVNNGDNTNIVDEKLAKDKLDDNDLETLKRARDDRKNMTIAQRDNADYWRVKQNK